MDTQPLISSVRARLLSSQSILSDMLPDHVVKLLMAGTLGLLQGQGQDDDDHSLAEDIGEQPLGMDDLPPALSPAPEAEEAAAFQGDLPVVSSLPSAPFGEALFKSQAASSTET